MHSVKQSASLGEPQFSYYYRVGKYVKNIKIYTELTKHLKIKLNVIYFQN